MTKIEMGFGLVTGQRGVIHTRHLGSQEVCPLGADDGLFQPVGSER